MTKLPNIRIVEELTIDDRYQISIVDPKIITTAKKSSLNRERGQLATIHSISLTPLTMRESSYFSSTEIRLGEPLIIPS